MLIFVLKLDITLNFDFKDFENVSVCANRSVFTPPFILNGTKAMIS